MKIIFTVFLISIGLMIPGIAAETYSGKISFIRTFSKEAGTSGKSFTIFQLEGVNNSDWGSKCVLQNMTGTNLISFSVPNENTSLLSALLTANTTDKKIDIEVYTNTTFESTCQTKYIGFE